MGGEARGEDQGRVDVVVHRSSPPILFSWCALPLTSLPLSLTTLTGFTAILLHSHYVSQACYIGAVLIAAIAFVRSILHRNSHYRSLP